ncbi:hypothetical protein [Sulfurirhabdus autotrophica]|uniref:Uncharacterized protein n=1 Tax=Sulfurirhabdus autotrophica TaxID=1706046 RepID=A0A4V2W0T4_9PROT|nr:hypothetical protein [Sulfurirhabdus autotrophica]TCV80089.1 hypothetical protein EDC63_1302 [Sulfurirhabdus autotrophica]
MNVTVQPIKVNRTQKRVQRWLLLFIMVLTTFPTSSFAISLNPSSVKGIAEAYGFILMQEYSLSRIEKDFPELSDRVGLARAQFGSTFPDIKSQLEAQIKKAMGDKQFQKTATTLQTKIREASGRQRITRDIAVNFLDQVKARSNGEIESPVLEYMLAVKYTSHPVDEFTDGFRQRYHTDGAGKSQGVQLNLQLPRSWTAKEGERPHIVQKWVSENGTGSEIIHLDIQDAQGYNPTKKEMEKYVRSGEAKNSVPDGFKYVASGNFTLEGQTGYWLQIAMPLERAGIKMYLDSLAYQFYFQGKSIGLMCQAGGPESEKNNVNEAFKRIQPLCQQVLNSLVLMQGY